MMAKSGGPRGANVVFLLCFQFVGVQIGDNELGRKRVGWVEGGVVVVLTGVTEGRGGQKEQLVMGRAVSWQELR